MAEKKNPVQALLTDEERTYLEEHMEQVTPKAPLSESVLTAVKISAMAGEASAQMELAMALLPQVAEVARLYAGQGACLEDLIGAGNEALVSGTRLLMALEDPQEVEGDLMGRVMRAMEAVIEEEIAEKAAGQQMADFVNKVAEKAEELSEALRRKVTPEELANEGELTLEEIREAVRMSGNQIEALDSKD